LQDKYLYTFMMDFRGGTYPAQVLSTNPEVPIRECAELLEREPPPVDDPEAIVELRAGFVEDDPVAVTGLTGVWCFGTRSGDDLALVHAVRTF